MADRQKYGDRRWSKTVLAYTVFLLVPICWLAVLSLQPDSVSRSTLTIWPDPLSLENYRFVFSRDDWVTGYANALIYVAINMIITLTVALPAAYAFSRFRFVGSEHALFFALIFRLLPPAIIMIPLVQVFSSAGMIDTHLAVALSHCLFTIPISIWILEGFISSIPTDLEEIAAADGYSPPGYFFKILLPQIRTGLGVTAFFCFLFSWVELILANALTTVEAKPVGVVMRLVASPLGGVHIGISAATSVLMLLPGIALVWALRRHLARGFSLGRIS